MTRTFPAFRKHWLALAATVVLLAAALTAGTLFAASEPQDPDLFLLSEQLPSDVTDPGLADEAPALMVEAELPENEAGSGVEPGDIRIGRFRRSDPMAGRPARGDGALYRGGGHVRRFPRPWTGCYTKRCTRK